MEIAGLVLAAGAGRRYGRAKALVAYRDGLLVRRAAGTLAAAACAPILVVIGAAADEVRTAAPELKYVDNPDWTTGMGSSLRAGLAALRATTAGAAVVLLVDMPGVSPAAVRRLADRTTTADLAIGGYGERRGHPVLLGRDHWAGVGAVATGDRGARDYLRDNSDQLRVVPVGDVADDFDIDTPEEAARHA